MRFAARLALVVGLAAFVPGSGLGSPQTASDPRPTLKVGTAEAARGQKATGVIAVPAGADAATNIAVAVVHGAKPGPVLAIVSGLHGTEYSSILAVERLIQLLDPAQLSGSVILVPLVNVASFEQKIAHVNPIDGKSMNRFYPGKADGTQTERASFLMTKEVVDQCDHLIDLHGGDLDESLRPYSYWTVTGNLARTRSRGRCCWPSASTTSSFRQTARKTPPRRATSRTRRPRAEAVDYGGGGARRHHRPGRHRRSCRRQRQRDALPAHPAGAPAVIENPVWIERAVALPSEQTGIFYPLVKRGTYVQSGMKIGYVTDYVGRTIYEARAPESGVVLYIRAVPSLTKGETVASVGWSRSRGMGHGAWDVGHGRPAPEDGRRAGERGRRLPGHPLVHDLTAKDGHVDDRVEETRGGLREDVLRQNRDVSQQAGARRPFLASSNDAYAPPAVMFSMALSRLMA